MERPMDTAMAMGIGYRPNSRPVVVTPAPWGAPPVHVGQPNVGFGFYF